MAVLCLVTMACTSPPTKPSIHTPNAPTSQHAATSNANKPNELKSAEAKPTEVKPADIARQVDNKTGLTGLSNATTYPQVSQYLSFADDFSNTTAEAQKQLLNTTTQALAKTPNDIEQRMRLVLIYGLPSSTLLDTAKAQSLLQQLLQESVLPQEQLPFANVLFDYIVAVNKAGKISREDQKRQEIMQQKLEGLQTKLENTQQKLEAAQQKIDELKNIEKSMGQREVVPKK